MKIWIMLIRNLYGQKDLPWTVDTMGEPCIDYIIDKRINFTIKYFDKNVNYYLYILNIIKDYYIQSQKK